VIAFYDYAQRHYDEGGDDTFLADWERIVEELGYEDQVRWDEDKQKFIGPRGIVNEANREHRRRMREWDRKDKNLYTYEDWDKIAFSLFQLKVPSKRLLKSMLYDPDKKRHLEKYKNNPKYQAFRGTDGKFPVVGFARKVFRKKILIHFANGDEYGFHSIDKRMWDITKL
jgi:hypothetical protein